MAFPHELFNNAVKYEVSDGIAVITMNQPESMNTMNGPLNQGVQVALDLASEDPNVRVVIFTGAGRAFCAGGGLSAKGESGASAGFKAKAGQAIPPTVRAAVR